MLSLPSSVRVYAALGATDMRGVVVVSGVAYGDGAGGMPLGEYFAEVLLLDQGTAAAKARADLGWNPSHPSLVDEFRRGSYAK